MDLELNQRKSVPARDPSRHRGANVYEVDDSWATYVFPLAGAFFIFTLIYLKKDD